MSDEFEDDDEFHHPPPTPRRPARRSQYIEEEREKTREAGRGGKASSYVRRLEEGFAMLGEDGDE